MSRNLSGKLSKTPYAPLLGLLALSWLPVGAVWAQSTGSTTFTTTTSFSQTLHTTSLEQQIDTYLTRIIGRVGSGPTIYDMSFNLPFLDPVVQSALLQAQTSLTSYAGTALDFSAPVLTTSSLTLAHSQVDTAQSSVTTVGLTLTNTIGPSSIVVGDLGTFDNPCQGYSGGGAVVAGGLGGFPADFHFTEAVTPVGCPGGTPFVVPAGTLNIDAALHTQTDIYRTITTTDTYLDSRIYELTGVLASASVPEPSTLGLFATALTGFALVRKRRREQRG